MKTPKDHAEELLKLKSLVQPEREPGCDDELIKPDIPEPKANLKSYILTEEEEAKSREAFLQGGFQEQEKYLKSIGKYPNAPDQIP